MGIDAVNSIITTYFAGERREVLVIMGVCVIAVALAGALYFNTKDGVSTGFGVLVLSASLLLTSTCFTLLRRDPSLREQLTSSIAGAAASTAISSEAGRLDRIIANYKFYRYGAITLAVLALGAVCVTRNGIINGVAAGILMLAAGQMIIDHYSENRARVYAAALHSVIPHK